MAKIFWLVWGALVFGPGLDAQPLTRVEVQYYGLPNCHDCQEFLAGPWGDVRRLAASQGTTLTLVEQDILDPHAFKAMKDVLAARGVPFTGVPVLVTPDRVLQGEDLAPGRLASAFGLSPPQASPVEAKAAPDFSWTVVALAGLVDGINPCVITLLLFLLSAWSVDRNQGLWWGIAYTLGVAVAYTGVGLGLLQVASFTSGYAWLGPVIRFVALVALVGFAGLSLWDAYQVGRGRTQALVLKLPGGVDRFIRRLIRNRRGTVVGLPLAFSLGAFISLLELVCTGQVYLPTLVYMNQVGAEDALGLLLLYNFAFVVPLLGVFGLVHWGTGHRALVLWAQKHLVATKLALALVFALLAGALAFST